MVFTQATYQRLSSNSLKLKNYLDLAVKKADDLLTTREKPELFIC